MSVPLADTLRNFRRIISNKRLTNYIISASDIKRYTLIHYSATHAPAEGHTAACLAAGSIMFYVWYLVRIKRTLVFHAQ